MWNFENVSAKDQVELLKFSQIFFLHYNMMFKGKKSAILESGRLLLAIRGFLCPKVALFY